MCKIADGYTDDTPRQELETCSDMLDDYWAQFQSAQLSIEATCGDKEIDMQVIEMVDTERVYQATKSRLKRFLKKYTDLDKQQGARGRAGPEPVNQNVNQANSRLPKLEVPHFERHIFYMDDV